MKKVQLDQSKLLGLKILPPMSKTGLKAQKIGGKIGGGKDKPAPEDRFQD